MNGIEITPMSLLTEMINFKKGDGNTYLPKAGETCLFSGPHCDDEDGFVYISVEVLWTDETFIITRVPGCWPNVDKWEHIRCKRDSMCSNYVEFEHTINAEDVDP